jgi:hypothetical protein
MNALSPIKLVSVVAVFVPFLAQAEEASASLQPEQIQRVVEERLAIMEKRIKLLGVTPRLTTEPADGEDTVANMEKAGVIIECTIKEVEAALVKAASTPETEDDIKAMRMLHWGSYRFFIDEGVESNDSQQTLK